MIKVKGYDERLKELRVERDVVIAACEARVLELDVLIDAINGLKRAGEAQK